MFNRFSLKKLFSFPGPKDLGMSDSNNAMPSNMFSYNNDRFTWEDYYERLKQLYPVRYFFGIAAVKFIRYKVYNPIKRSISDAIYWLKCHTLPSYKFHLIDIRQKKSGISNVDDYRYGYREVSDKMLLACFTLLNYFIEEEKGFYCPSEKDIENAEQDEKHCLIKQRDDYRELMKLYHWWNNDRKWDYRLKQDFQNDWWEHRKINPNSAQTKNLFYHLNLLQNQFDEKEEEMLIRLMKIRHKLWT